MIESQISIQVSEIKFDYDWLSFGNIYTDITAQFLRPVFDRVYGVLRHADPGYARISPAGTLAE